MSHDSAVANHYTHGNLLGAIQASVSKLGKTVENVTVEDLGPVDEFHIGGRLATDRLLRQLDFSRADHILDVGCGLGGASRFVADQLGNRVTGIDLTQEYIDAGNVLCSWVGLDRQVTLHHGSALSMPFDEESFDGGFMLHVGMNIEDKNRLFAEIHRVLKPSTSFGVYDVMRSHDGELAYPVPWAAAPGTSKLGTPGEYKRALRDTGFEIVTEEDRRGFALEFFQEMREKTPANGCPPPLGLHTLMQDSTAVKVKNMIDSIAGGLIAPVAIVARKR
jgi:ubiquinone/menaquinone biosynthesis C-methylase UbiE